MNILNDMNIEYAKDEDAILLTEKQVDNIVFMVIEKILNRMPKVMGNLMAQQATANKMKKDFYTKYPEFVDHKDVVLDVITKIEGKNLTSELDEILMQAVPEIRRKIAIKKTLNFDKVGKSQDINKTILDETDIEVTDISKNEDDNDNGVI